MELWTAPQPLLRGKPSQTTIESYKKIATTTDPRPIWQGIIDNKITQWRRQTSQISEEIRLLARNGKLTPKLRKNRNWMRKELKDKPTKQRLKEYKEKNINQLRVNKLEREKRILAHKRKAANK